MRLHRAWTEPARLGRVSAVTAVGALLLSVAACGGGDEGGSGGTAGGEGSATAAGAEVSIGLITKTETNPFFVTMREAATAAAEEQGVELTALAGKFDGDNEGQVAAIENLIAQGVDGIMITPSLSLIHI